jgi:hypothetical protein
MVEMATTRQTTLLTQNRSTVLCGFAKLAAARPTLANFPVFPRMALSLLILQEAAWWRWQPPIR